MAKIKIKGVRTMIFDYEMIRRLMGLCVIVCIICMMILAVQLAEWTDERNKKDEEYRKERESFENKNKNI